MRFAALGGSILLLLLFVLAALGLGGVGWIVAAVILAVPAGVGIYDVLQRRHSILRNHPLVGHAVRAGVDPPEVQQYFVERNDDGRPFDRDTRTAVYERAKGVKDEQAYGTERDVAEPRLRVAPAHHAHRAAQGAAARAHRRPDCTQAL